MIEDYIRTMFLLIKITGVEKKAKYCKLQSNKEIFGKCSIVGGHREHTDTQVLQACNQIKIPESFHRFTSCKKKQLVAPNSGATQLSLYYTFFCFINKNSFSLQLNFFFSVCYQLLLFSLPIGGGEKTKNSFVS